MQIIALAVLFLLIAGCAHVASPTIQQPLQEAARQRPSASVTAGASYDLPEAEEPVSMPAAAASITSEFRPDLQPSPSIEATASPPLEQKRPAVDSDWVPATLWGRVTAGFALEPMDNELVRAWENWYATRPDYVARMIDRSSHFLFHILEEVEKRGMPTEIALLPMIESAYNPLAYSTAHASGIWQFIPSTGKHYGLRQTWWYDGRRDVIAATEAALDYLEKLHAMFGDWELALASYNWGEGAVSRAVERNRAKGLPDDYEYLPLPSETRSYLPKLIAVRNIIADPGRFGLEIEDIPNEPYFETLTLERHIDVRVAAKLAEMPMDEFKFLNPGHNKPVIKAGEAERIVLPRGKVATFRSNLKKYDRPLVSWNTVRLRRGDKVKSIAAKHGMTLTELKTANGIARHRRVVPGQVLLVRVREGVADPELPDMAVRPVPVHRAVKEARAKSAMRKGMRVHVRRATVRPNSRATQSVRVREQNKSRQLSGKARPAKVKAVRASKARVRGRR
jgi:membrane-bound lytic murein transglycosylase D